MFFLSCDIKTGAILSELPLQLSGEIMRAMMTPTTASLSLPVTDPACPENWDELTAPWRVCLALLDEDGHVWWAGIPVARTMSAPAPVVEISCGSLETYLGRRVVPPRRFDRADQCSDIAAWLVASTLDAGIPMELDTPTSGVLRDRDYTADEAGTVLQRLTDLSEVINGPEWWIETRLTGGDGRKLTHVFHTGYPRLGVTSNNPRAIFELPGSLLEVKAEERWGENEAATYVIVEGEGEGETKPRSNPHVALDQEWAGYPRLELIQAAQNVTERATLEDKAARTLARLSEGTRVYTLTHKAGEYPRVGVDWDMGDDVRVKVNASFRMDEVLRLIGWKINSAATLVTPIVAGLKTERTPGE